MLLMTIGELARRAGVGVETVRFYQRKGLLAQPARRPGRRRLYTPEHLAALRFVRRCKGLGFSLKEMVPLVALRRTSARSCRSFHDIVHEAIHALDAKKQLIEVRRAALARMLDQCPGKRGLRDCQVLAAFEE